MPRHPFSAILGDKTVSDQCMFQLDSLAELPDLVRKHNQSAR
nr:hypothetical protein [Salinispora pacifica]